MRYRQGVLAACLVAAGGLAACANQNGTTAASGTTTTAAGSTTTAAGSTKVEECPAPEVLEAEGYTCDSKGNLTPIG